MKPMSYSFGYYRGEPMTECSISGDTMTADGKSYKLDTTATDCKECEALTFNDLTTSSDDPCNGCRGCWKKDDN